MGLKRCLRILKKVLEVNVVRDHPHLVDEIKKEIKSSEAKLGLGLIR